MPRPLLQLVAFALLLVQGLIAVAPGRTLCIEIFDCGRHHPAEEVCSDELSTACLAVATSESCCRHECEDTQAAPLHSHDCGCHVHLPVPGENQLPMKPQLKGELLDLRGLIQAVVVVAVIEWDSDPAPGFATDPRPPDFCASDQALVLKTTRLLI